VSSLYPINLIRKATLMGLKLPRWESINFLVEDDVVEEIPTAPALVGSVPTFSAGKVPSAWKVSFPSISSQSVKESILCELAGCLSLIKDKALSEFTLRGGFKEYLWIKETDLNVTQLEIQYSDNTWIPIDKANSEEELLSCTTPMYYQSEVCVLISGVEFSRSLSTTTDGFAFSTDPCFDHLDSIVYFSLPSSNRFFVKSENRSDRYLGVKTDEELVVLTLYKETYNSLTSLNIKINGGSSTSASIKKIYSQPDKFLFKQGVLDIRALSYNKERALLLPKAQILNQGNYLLYVLGEITNSNIYQETSLGGYFNQDSYNYFQEKTYSDWNMFVEKLEIKGGKTYSRFTGEWGTLFTPEGPVSFTKSGNEYTTTLVDGSIVYCQSYNPTLIPEIGHIRPVNDNYVGERTIFQIADSVHKVEKIVFNRERAKWGNRGEYSFNNLYINT